MSGLSERITIIMHKPGEDPFANDNVPTWCKYLARVCGSLGGLLGLLAGFIMCTHLFFADFGTFGLGLTVMGTAFLVLVIEAPCFFLFIAPVQIISDFADKRPYWNRALVYMILAVGPYAIFLDYGSFSIFGSGLIFATAIIYGVMAIGFR